MMNRVIYQERISFEPSAKAQSVIFKQHEEILASERVERERDVRIAET